MIDLSIFEDLPHNWDGYDAMAPEMETIENFRDVVNKLKWPPFDISPDTNGCMSIQSDTLTGTDFHLQVGVSKWTMYVRLGGGEKVKFESEGVFGVDDFPLDNAQKALDTLR